MIRRFLLVSALVFVGCSSDDTSSSSSTPAQAVDGTSARFELDHDPTTQDSFFDQPYPLDLRLTEAGTPDLRGFPNPDETDLINGLVGLASKPKGFPTVATAYFRFSSAMNPLDIEAVIPGETSSPILLVDVDPTSDERGRLIPTVAVVVPDDAFLPPNTLAIAPRPGFILHPKRTYAFVVQRSLKDAAGKPLGSNQAFEQVKAGQAPAGSQGQKAVELYKPLWETLKTLNISPSNVAAATVFTTADVISDLADLTDKLLAKYDLEITDLTFNAEGGPAPADGPQRVCEIHGKVKYPQFQVGTPPFNTDGLFTYGDDGLPIKQRDEEAPIVLTIPRTTMPTNGFPLVVYFHGSGGLSTAAVDRGTWRPQDTDEGCPPVPAGHDIRDEWDGVLGCNTKGTGPAYVVANYGFGTAASALPLNPERLPGAADTAYLNINNPKSFHDTFTQGVFEQRLFIRAVSKLEIPASVVAACDGVQLPSGATSFKYDTSNLIAQGQSMGGMYTNLVSSVEPTVKACVPTGAGGLWSYFVMKTPLYNGLAGPLSNLVGAPLESFSFVHPTMSLLQAAWETVDPMVAVPRLAKNPLPNHPVRPVYEPVAKGDSFFATVTYDAMAIAYGNQRAGEVVWDTMDPALALDNREPTSFPVSQNLSSGDTKYTGVVVQFEGDGVYDPHAIYSQRDDVKHQYSCFMKSFVETGVATVPAKGGVDDACAP
ncbi:MAG: hypothetical protein U0165_15515 [Polyangiaceae bacterium]